MVVNRMIDTCQTYTSWSIEKPRGERMATESFFEDMVIDTPEAAANLTAMFVDNIGWKRGNSKCRMATDKEARMILENFSKKEWFLRRGHCPLHASYCDCASLIRIREAIDQYAQIHRFSIKPRVPWQRSDWGRTTSDGVTLATSR